MLLMQRLRDIPPLLVHVLSFLDDRDAVLILHLDSHSGSAMDGYRVKALMKYPTYARYRLSTRRLHVSQIIRVPQPLSAMCALPRSVTRLTLASNFNDVIPPRVLRDRAPSLTHLTFQWKFDTPLEVDSLPDTITHLVLSRMFNQPILPGHLPASLTDLTIGKMFSQPLSVDMFPPQLTHLTFKGAFDAPLPVGALPDFLARLTLTAYPFDLTVGALPLSLLELELCGNNRKLLPGVLPASLLRLTLGRDFTKTLFVGVLPRSLQCVKWRVWRNGSRKPILSSWFPLGCEVSSEDQSCGITLYGQPEDSTAAAKRLGVDCPSDYFCPDDALNKSSQAPATGYDALSDDGGDLSLLYTVDD